MLSLTPKPRMLILILSILASLCLGAHASVTANIQFNSLKVAIERGNTDMVRSTLRWIMTTDYDLDEQEVIQARFAQLALRIAGRASPQVWMAFTVEVALNTCETSRTNAVLIADAFKAAIESLDSEPQLQPQPAR